MPSSHVYRQPTLSRAPGSVDIRVVVADQAARYALTTADVQNGDYVYQTDTAILYLVTDQTALNGEGGYTPLATVTWDQVTDKPSTFPPVIGSGPGDAVAGNDPRLTDPRTPISHTHTASEISDAGAAFPAFAQAETHAEQAELLASELRLRSPDNSIWKLSISNDGVISQTKLT